MNKYTYINPLNQGYKQFTLTKKQHNELFKYRQITWKDKYEYYYNDNEILLHKFANVPIKILATILFPFYLLFYGISNCKELIEEMKSGYNQKKYGSFTVDSVSNGSDIYSEIIKIINKKGRYYENKRNV